MARPKDEFDKDYIYNLIMPSAHPPAQPEHPSPSTPPEAAGESAISDLKQRLFSRKNGAAVAIPAAVKPEVSLVNLMELLVADQLDAAFSKFNCCKCDKCRKDAAAAALNLLAPEYVAATPDEIAALLARHTSKEVSAALVKAILQVRAHPNHSF